MIKADVYLLINNAWVVQDWIYPVVLNKTLDESLDNGAFTIYGSTQKALFPNFTKCKIVLSDMTGEAVTYTETRYYYANDDAKQSKFVPPYTYNHTITLIEPTKILEKYIICGQGTSQPIAAEKDIKYIDGEIDRLLAANPTRRTTDTQLFVLDESLRTKLHIKSPEFRWTCKMTLFECLHEVGKYIGAMPRLIPLASDDKVYNTVSFEYFGEIEDNITELEFSGYAVEQDENQYCTELETYVENCIEDGDTIVTYPAPNAWITARSDELAPTEENIYIPTPTPIERVKRVLVRNVRSKSSTAEGIISDAATGEPLVMDITPFVITKEKWDTLDILTAPGWFEELCKNNSFYYEQRKNNVGIITNKYNDIIFSGLKVYSVLIYCYFDMILGSDWVTIKKDDGTLVGGVLLSNGTQVEQNLIDWQFQIEYVAQTSGRAKAVKQII